MRGDGPGSDRPARRSVAASLVTALIRAYRWTAPVRGPRCRFYPTCSTYALQAVATHGAARGTWLAARRLGRCHPWNPGGVDHVPPIDRQPTTPDGAPAAPSRK